jgi:hypothetical protein
MKPKRGDGRAGRSAPARSPRRADDPSHGAVTREALDVARYITGMTANVDEPELFFPAAAPRTDEIAPCAAVGELRMGDAGELLFVTEGDDAMPVLEPDRARGLEARRGKAQELVEENAAVRVASAFGHELRRRLAATTCAVSLYHKHRSGHLCPQQS